MRRGALVERTATMADGVLAVGELVRSGTSMAYLLAAAAPRRIDEVVAEHFRDLPSPFAHLAD